MTAITRIESASPRLRDETRGSGPTVSATAVFCVAQVVMVVANLVRIPLLSAGDRDVPITLNELCVAAMLAAAFLVVLSRRVVRLDRVAIIALLFAAIGGGSALWSLNRFDLTPLQLLVSLAFLARWVVYFGVYVAIINVVDERGVEVVWKALETMLLLFGAFGIFQAAFLPGFAQMVYPDSRAYVDWDPQGHRLVSTILDPNLAGAMLMIGLLVQLGRISVGATQSRWAVLTLFVALCLTLSRGVAFGFMGGVGTLLLARGPSKRLFRVGAVAAGLLAAVSPLLLRYALAYGKFSLGQGSSAALRLESWLVTLKVIGSYPIFGVGFNAYKYALMHFGLDRPGPSSYGGEGGLLFIMAMTGIVGLTVYCLMLGHIVARCRSIWRDVTVAPAHRGIAIGVAASLVAVVLASASANAITTSVIMEMLWLLAGLTFVIARSRDDRRARSAQAPRTLVVSVT